MRSRLTEYAASTLILLVLGRRPPPGPAGRGLALPAFERLQPFEKAMRRVPIAEQRAALAAAGAPLTAETYGTAVPRRGVRRMD